MNELITKLNGLHISKYNNEELDIAKSFLSMKITEENSNNDTINESVDKLIDEMESMHIVDNNIVIKKKNGTFKFFPMICGLGTYEVKKMHNSLPWVDAF